VTVSIEPLSRSKWSAIKKQCTSRIGSLLDLLQGKIPGEVMKAVTNQDNGLFPSPREISYSCSCPDYASMCKHVAAVLYGVGARLDHSPAMLFELRGVDVEELIDSSAEITAAQQPGTGGNRLDLAVLDDVFGIEIDTCAAVPEPVKPKTAPAKQKTAPAAKAKPAPARKTGSRMTPVRGEDIARLRQKFSMTQGEFGQLIGVSAPTISNWERTRGELNLREEKLRAFKEASRMSIHKAWEKLEEEG